MTQVGSDTPHESEVYSDSNSDIYANTEEVVLEDEKLFLMGVDEPVNYG